MKKKKKDLDILFEDDQARELIEKGRKNRDEILFNPKSDLFVDYINKVPLDMERIKKENADIQLIDLVYTEKVLSFVQDKAEAFDDANVQSLLGYLPSFCKCVELFKKNISKEELLYLCFRVSDIFSAITVERYMDIFEGDSGSAIGAFK